MSLPRTGFRGRLSFLANHIDSSEEEEPVEEPASPPPARNPDQHALSPGSVSSGIFFQSPANPLRKSRDPKDASPTVPVRPPPTAKPKDFASTPPYSDAHSTPPHGGNARRKEAVGSPPQQPPAQLAARTTPFTNAVSPRINTPRSNRMTLPLKNSSVAAANVVPTPRSSRVPGNSFVYIFLF